jgi:hypothetical protein
MEQDRTGRVDEGALVQDDRTRDESIAGTGGGSGAGTIEGEGELSGGRSERGSGVESEASILAGTAHGADSAAALGNVDGSLADAAQRSNAGAEQTGPEHLTTPPTGAEAIGSGAGRGEVGSGTAGDTSEAGTGGETGPVSSSRRS